MELLRGNGEISEHDAGSYLVSLIGALCALHRVPFDARLLAHRFPPPHHPDALLRALRELGFHAKRKAVAPSKLAQLSFPLIADMEGGDPTVVLHADGENVAYLSPHTGQGGVITEPHTTFAAKFAGRVVQAKVQSKDPSDPDGARRTSAFGFGWFVPELLKHKTVWKQVLLASLFLQLVSLAFPLITQAVVDKVVVHRTQSTLIVLGTAMGIFVVFTALLGWVRQYLVLHTGNRVDAVLGATVFEHLFKLPVKYFEYRPTGVIAARLHGVETIREFIASAAISLVLDVPFLLIAVAVMFTYSVPLTLIVLGILCVIGILSFLVAPLFQRRLNQQFLLGARNQAFVTEHVAGHETVKSLQMEPLLNARYSDYLATYLQSGFATKQIGNTYNTVASAMEQVMTVLVLMVGAWAVMNPPPGAAPFTIGMLVAFQMFAGRISQPMLRLVGLWQQFQEASLAVQRLGDLMNAPAEPYALTPSRQSETGGRVEFEAVGFRYGEDRPYLYRDVHLNVEPGRAITIMGPSGSGKSTLAKLLQGFYRASEGTIKVDGVDTRHLSANELRNYFGVVPQETILFSGTIYDNLLAANPSASFDEVVDACKKADIHSTIEALSQGYKTEIGERGTGLSGGQKQRIAIARALLKRPRILIFDEATSALDHQTAEAFAATVNQLKGQVTLIFIAHALPRTLHVDEVYVIRDGVLRKAVARVKEAQA
ncbi:peptidase domain-containing ABC transporter [Variovorax sp. OV700]|uniref:peptidase domain-containing ABC transporter n=1 Tax=Variovorax sp. OV700 TaxID=1882826 RepID=UPI0008837895|nr:peptidase domain-containing ABC transporter [Variovorax sp. OV700]SDJ80636.1 ATP-binding cassette, subfamily B, HlyB/CyaB [Variovorax sp. OV700]